MRGKTSATVLPSIPLRIAGGLGRPFCPSASMNSYLISEYHVRHKLTVIANMRARSDDDLDLRAAYADAVVRKPLTFFEGLQSDISLLSPTPSAYCSSASRA